MNSRACSICGKPLTEAPVAQTDASPFCSERCRLIDLGRWLGERYRVGSPITPEEVIEEVDAAAADEI